MSSTQEEDLTELAEDIYEFQCYQTSSDIKETIRSFLLANHYTRLGEDYEKSHNELRGLK